MELYTKTSYEMSRLLTQRYSTSFSTSSRLFSATVRNHIYAIYGMVRLADEIVDTYRGDDAAAVLNDFEGIVVAACVSGYSTNPIVHAFAQTAREFSIEQVLITPFFDSMRTDITRTEYDQAAYERYIYGSAEVIGLMCLRVFSPADEYEQLKTGARALGSAYQKVNFLRDMAADYKELGRLYFPGEIEYETFSEVDKQAIIADIERDFQMAEPYLSQLPVSARRAVILSRRYYGLLLQRIKSTPVETLKVTRIRVPNTQKLALLVRTELVCDGTKVIIIGGGIGGLGTANLLAAAGYEVTILEQHDTLGGRAGLLVKDGFRFDTGPSWYLMPGVFEHYFDLLGETTESLDLQRLSPAYKIFFESQPAITVTSDLTVDAASFEAVEAGAGKALRRYVAKSQELYQLSLRHFLYTNFERTRDLLKPDLLRSVAMVARLLVTPIDRYVGTFVRDQRLKQILEYPMVFLGTSPFTAPAMYSLMSAMDFEEGVFYPKRGMYSIIEKMQQISQRVGVTVRTRSRVDQILVENGHAHGVRLQDGTTLTADIVISNADLHFTETKLLEQQWQTFPESYWKPREAGPTALLLYLGIKGELPEFEHHNLLFVEAWRQNFTAIYDTKESPEKASMYISKTSQTDPSSAPDGHENIFVLIPSSQESLSRTDYDQLAQHYLQQITDMTGVDLLARAVTKEVFYPDLFDEKFNSWQSSMLGQSHLLKQSALFRTPNKSRKVDNLYYVGGLTVPGIGLPMCLIGAELVYKRITGDKKAGPVDRL